MKENYKYIKNITQDEGLILLYGEIGRQVDGNYFAYELKFLQTVCNKITIGINSVGGSVLEGYSILSAMLNSKVPVNTRIDGLAASMAGVISLAGVKRSIMDYGSWMGHCAAGKDQRVADMATDSIVTILSNNSNKSKEDIMAMLEKETWISDSKKADYSILQAKNMGFFDEVISSKRKIRLPENLADMAEVYNKITEKPTMENTNQAELDALKNELAQAKEANKALKEKLDAAEARELEASNKAKEEAKKRAETLVNKAVKDGLLSQDEAAENIEMAITNYAGVEKLISKISPVKEAVKVFDFTKVANKKGGTEDRTTWNIRQWEKEDPKGLAEIKNSTPEIYNEMFNAYYKKQK